jgi:hypothetical protein
VAGLWHSDCFTYLRRQESSTEKRAHLRLASPFTLSRFRSTLFFHLTFSGFNSLRLDTRTSNVSESRGENMKRYRWAIPLVAAATFALFTVYVHAQYETATQANGLNGLALAPADISLGQATRGVVFKTAAINSDGTVANCFRCVKVSTIHLGTGQYQIAFDENVQATNGWSRWVQPDTLGIGAKTLGVTPRIALAIPARSM